MTIIAKWITYAGQTTHRHCGVGICAPPPPPPPPSPHKWTTRTTYCRRQRRKREKQNKWINIGILDILVGILYSVCFYTDDRLKSVTHHRRMSPTYVHAHTEPHIERSNVWRCKLITEYIISIISGRAKDSTQNSSRGKPEKHTFCSMSAGFRACTLLHAH